MAGFKADGALAAMSQRAHQILAGRGMGVSGDGVARIAPPVTPPPGGASNFLAARLQSHVSRAGEMTAILRRNAQTALAGAMRTGVMPGAPISQARAAAAAAARSEQDRLRSGNVDLRDFMYGTRTPGGMSDEQLYARARAAGGNGVPVHVMHEGEITVQNGRRGQFIKYLRPDGYDTVWVPID